jgi:hypothetical protein
MFLLTTASRAALVPTQPPIQWVSGALLLGVKRPGLENDNSVPSAKVKNTWSYTSTPNAPSWRGKGKGKVALCFTKHHAMKIYWGNGGIAPRIIDLGTRWRWVVSFTPRPLYPQGKNPWYPLNRRLGGPQSRFGHCGEEKNSQPPPGIEP